MKQIILTGILFILSITGCAQIFIEQTDVLLHGIYKGEVDWGDYNNDGLLDFMMTGDGGTGNLYYAGIYKNMGNNIFEEDTGVITPVKKGSLDWGDYNNDNYIDIIYAGYHIKNNQWMQETEICRNNSNETFTKLESTGLITTDNGCIKWADYSRDGYLDIFQSGFNSGYFISRIYKNLRDNAFTYQPHIQIHGVLSGSVAWGDYNNDGLTDFIFTGGTNYFWITKIYKNNGDNTFTPQDEIDIIDISAGSTDWGDYNNDGFIDLAITGQHKTEKKTILITKIYKNNGGKNFTELTGNDFVGITWGGALWGDYNNDGLLDLVLAGWTEKPNGMGQKEARLYLNNGNDIFTEQSSSGLVPVGDATVAWGDYDNDNDLDLLLAGFESDASYTAKLYKNNIQEPNIRPNSPGNLQTKIVGNEVWFSWDAATDNNQPSAGLSYNIYVYDENNPLPYIDSPQAFPQNHALNGKRFLAQRGHIQGIRKNGRVSYIFKGVFENCKRYRWSVQAVDASFAGGKFAPEQSFVYDTIAPEIECPENLEILIPHNETSYTLNSIELDPVRFSDNCDNVIISNNYNSDTTLMGTVFPLGITEIEWTVDDSAGNQTICTVSIEIKQENGLQKLIEDSISIIPNPSDGFFTIRFSDASNILPKKIQIISLSGNITKEIKTNDITLSTVNIDLKGIAQGFYYINIYGENYFVSKKLIIY